MKSKYTYRPGAVIYALVLSALTFPALSAAQGFYGAIAGGFSTQASDSQVPTERTRLLPAQC